jgi:hypothetical protein
MLFVVTAFTMDIEAVSGVNPDTGETETVSRMQRTICCIGFKIMTDPLLVVLHSSGFILVI